MNIMLFLPHLNKGGAEVLIVEHANKLSINHKVTLFIFLRGKYDSYNINLLSNDVELISLINFKFKFGGLYERIINKLLYIFSPFISVFIILRHNILKYDVLHFNLTLPSFYSIFFCLVAKLFNCKVKTISTFHSNWHLIKSFNKIILSLSWSLVNEVVWEIGVDEDVNIRRYSKNANISFIPLPIIDYGSVNRNYQQNFINKWNIDLRNKIIMSVSRLRFFEKKIDFMLLVTKKLLEMGYTDYHFVHVGDGPDRLQAINLVKDLEIKNNVTFTEYSDDPLSLIDLADIYLMAVVGDDPGISGLQSAAHGVPSVGIQTLSNFNTNKSIFFSSKNVSDVANFIIKLRDDKVRNSYIDSTITHISCSRSIDMFTKNYESLYIK